MLGRIKNKLSWSRRRDRRIAMYFLLHGKGSEATDEIEHWVINKVAEIWFDETVVSKLRLSMHIADIHELWYKHSMGDALEVETFCQETEQTFGFVIPERDAGNSQRPTLGDWAGMIKILKTKNICDRY